MIPGCTDTIWSIGVIDPGLVSEGFPIDSPENFTLVLHVLLWYFSNIQAKKGESFLIFLIFLGIIPILDITRRDLKEQWLNLWCQTRISLSPYTKMTSDDQILAISSLMSSAPTASLSTSSKLVMIWYGLSVGFRRYSISSRILSWPQIRISRCLPRDPH